MLSLFFLAIYCFNLYLFPYTNFVVLRLVKNGYLLGILLLLSTLQVFSQNFHTISGFVLDENNEALVGANIRVVNLNVGATTNALGSYELKILEGLNRISVSYLGYQTQVFELVTDKDLTKNIYLVVDQKQLAEVVVRNKRRDFSYEVIKNVIANKNSFQKQYQNFKAEVYIKSVEESPAKSQKTKEIDDPEQKNVSAKNTADSLSKINLFECQLLRYEQTDGKQKEEKTAVKKIGEQHTLFYKSITDGEFNLYKNHQKIAKIGDNEITSPISDLAFLSYKYQLLSFFYEGNDKIYRIKVSPRELGNALYEGELEVIDEKWIIRSANLQLTKRALLRYNTFGFSQKYEHIQNRWMPTQTNYQWKVKENGKTRIGNALVIQKNFTFDSTYARKFFGPEVGLTTEQAYKKDSIFWSSIRPKPLEKKEIQAIQEKERLDILHSSKIYLDSIDRVFNKLTLPKLLYIGIGHINRAKKTEWRFEPILGLLDPVAIGGWRVQYGTDFTKKFENRKEISIGTHATYGFKNNDLKGFVWANYFYNPTKISNVRLAVGSGFNVINGNATLQDLVKRKNFYQNKFYDLRHRTELLNGFYFSSRAYLEYREDLSGYKFAKLGETIFGTDNSPGAFAPSQMFKTSIGLHYTPRQLYLREPNQKLILGSKYPTFGLSLEKAWPSSSKNVSAFTSVNATVRQSYNVGVFGISEYRIEMGKFLDTTRLSVMDYKYQRGGDNYFFSPSMYTYQLIPATFPTFNWYFESHYSHQFNGYFTSKVPLLNKTGIREVAGGGLLYVPERKYQYSELYGGLNRIFKIGREYIRLGAYYVVSQANDVGFRSGFKFSFEPYNQSRNTWSF
jgi:hypothetical protein